MKEELINRILSGDEYAFKALVNKYRNTVFRSAIAVLHEPEEAKDVMQNVFLKVHQHLSELNQQSAFESWLKRITYNLAINRLKEKARLNHISLDEIDDEEPSVPSEDEKLLKKEIVDEILKTVNELPREESVILKEHILENKGYEELSQKYGLSYHAVVMRIRRAKEKVRKSVLKKLGGIITIPWKEIVKLLGGIAMKVKTIVVITTMVMLAGIGIFLMYESDEKPVANPSKLEANKQVKISKSKKVSSNKTNSKEDSFLKQYSDAELKEFLAWLDSLEEEEIASEKNLNDEIEKESEIRANIKKRKKRIEEINRQIQRLDEHIQLFLDEANAIGRYAVVDLGNTFLKEQKEYSRATDEAETLEEVESIPPPMSPEEWLQKDKELMEQRKEILDVVHELRKDRRALTAERKQLEQLNEVAQKGLQH